MYIQVAACSKSHLSSKPDLSRMQDRARMFKLDPTMKVRRTDIKLEREPRRVMEGFSQYLQRPTTTPEATAPKQPYIRWVPKSSLKI